MMTGKLYIDRKDAFTNWGIYAQAQGWNELLSYPPLKTPEANDWQEEDGIDPDLSAPVLNTREVTVRFAYSGDFNRLEGLVAVLSDGAYHEFDIASIGRKFSLRMTQTPNLDIYRELGFINIKFADDFPMKGDDYTSPESSLQRTEDYLLDGVPFTNYGCRILKGTLSEIVKPSAVKQNLLRNIASQPGVIYDNGPVTFKAKDVKLSCLMRAETLQELWRNYDALLFDLIRPDERILGVKELQSIFPCHYKSANVTGFYPEGKIWLAFTLTLTFTHSFRLDNSAAVLATEDGVPIASEDFEFSFNCIPQKQSAK